MYRYTIRHKGRVEAEGTVDSLDDMRAVDAKYKEIVAKQAASKWNRMFAPWSNEIAQWMSEWCITIEKTEPTPIRFEDIIAEIRRRPDLCTQIKRVI